MKWKEMGYIFWHRKYTNNTVKPVIEGGFSSKKKIENSFEAGYGARTHRPSLSSKEHPKYISLQPKQEEASRNMVSVPEGALGTTKM